MKAFYYFTLLFALSVVAPVTLFWPVGPPYESEASDQPSISLSPDYLESIKSMKNETVAQYQERRRKEALDACFTGKNPAGFMEIAPMYIDTLTLDKPSFSWSAPCFQDTQISLNIVDNSTVEIIHVNNKPASLLCSDTYYYNMYTNFRAKVFAFSGTNKVVLENLTPKEMNQIRVTGVQIFKICANFLDIIPGLMQSISLFLGGFGHNPDIPFFGSKPTEYQESQNVKFLEEVMNVKWDIRPHDIVVDLDESLIQSGDFIAVTRFDGIESLIAYGCGSLVGHGTMALRVNGELYIVESQSAWYWPKDGIQMNPYKQWIQWARNAGYHVTWLPLKKEYSEKFNAEAAYKVFKTLEGTPYGFHNFIFGWLDTPNRSYPPLLSPEFIGACMAMLESISPFAASQFFTLALNKRLGTENLTVAEIALEAASRGMQMQDLYAIVEEDTWEYPDGKSFVCSAFVAMMWKSGGLFGDLKVHATEFTPRDIYQLEFLDPNPQVPENCKQVDPENKFCQIMGKYRMTFPGISTVKAYDHMNEGCWSEAPGYHRGPDQC